MPIMRKFSRSCHTALLNISFAKLCLMATPSCGVAGDYNLYTRQSGAQIKMGSSKRENGY